MNFYKRLQRIFRLYEIKNKLKEAGCYQYQGGYYSMAVPKESYVESLRIAALKNEITMVASLKNQSYSEVERILNQNFSNLIKK